MKPRHRIPDPNWVPGTQPKPAMTPTEMSQRWPTSPPDNLALPLGQWVDPDTAEQPYHGGQRDHKPRDRQVMADRHASGRAARLWR